MPRSSSSSSSSSSSEAGGEELRLLRRLEAERLRLREERRRHKDALKAAETAEQKRARRLHEKQQKERRRRERMGWDGEYQCYTDQDNPFGDSALTDTFVWSKKLARQGVTSVSRQQLEADSRRKQLENKAELEKVKSRRLQREAERAARDQDAAVAARAREAAHYSCWQRQEDAFHLQQAQLRSQIRIRDGRAKPVDLLACYVASEGGSDADLHEPYAYLAGLSARDLEDLLADVAVYQQLQHGEHHDFWDDVTCVAEDELARLRGAAGGASAAGDGTETGARRGGVHGAVAADVSRVFRGKSAAQLQQLRTHIETKIAARQDGLDVAYWESLLGQLKAHCARARLRDRHQENLRRKLQLLRREEAEQGTTGEPGPSAECPPPSPLPPPPLEEPPSSDEEESCMSEYRAGRYSPAPLSPAALEPAQLLVEADEDRRRLAYLRAGLVQPSSVTEPAGVMQPPPLGPDEAPFSTEQPLECEPPLWADKFRPRKPRYFNRVHTGFEWNKYNQTHYDMDNPPPKIVQGYKFNIFYPDLMSNEAPEFSLQPCGDNPEFAVLRFRAGPPYEDIAFKIVNREWEYSYKRGFRCHFHNNVFQLWFHFKRYRYRR